MCSVKLFHTSSGSGGASTSGQASACAGEERPSLFSDSGNRLPPFNPFAAAVATLGPAERYESEFMGASEFLNRRLNEEFQRAFEAGIPSSALYPSPEIYHIGTPSDRTTSEGFRSALSHGTSSVPSYPTSSPVSFGPSTPVQSASAAPVFFPALPDECVTLSVNSGMRMKMRSKFPKQRTRKHNKKTNQHHKPNHKTNPSAKPVVPREMQTR